MVSQQSIDLLSMYGHYNKGHLPYEGGILNQPNAIYEAFSMLNQFEERVGMNNAS